MTTRLDLEEPIWVGDTFTLPLHFFEGEDVNGDPLPNSFSLEGRTLVFTLKRSIGIPDSQADIQFQHTFPNPDTLAATGEFTIVIPPSGMSALKPGCYIYQVQLITPALVPEQEDDVTTFIWGKVTVGDS